MLRWYDECRRDLPWRNDPSPYRVWVSEVMLQQTQVATVLPYFERWMSRFPTLQSLADASEDEAFALWQGLGYYSRCRNLLVGARWLEANGIPTTAEAWRHVPGVGRYTAGAVASIAFGDVCPVVDGNVRRVYSRLEADAKSGLALDAAAWTWADRNVDEARPGCWNQALMEFGARVCKPRQPKCHACPLARWCLALQHGTADSLPTKTPKPRTQALDLNLFIPRHAARFGVRKLRGIWWNGLWGFGLDSWSAEGDVRHVGDIRHTVTKHRVTMRVHEVTCRTRTADWNWLTPRELERLGLPAPMRKAMSLVSIRD